MSGFSAEWLALREPADRAARAEAPIAAAAEWLAGRAAPLVCDLGSGTGAAVAAFGPCFPAGTGWLLVDNDAANLAEARRRHGAQTRLADLSRDVAPWPAETALVTATALFDLAAPGWIAAMAGALARDRLPILSTLTYDGHIALHPEHPLDDPMIAAFNRHQRTDKGLGGPAAGPDADDVLATALAGHGYKVIRAPSPWRLRAGPDDALIGELLRGWAAAMAEAAFVGKDDTRRWLGDRLERTDSLEIGHGDLFAAPPPR